MSKEPLASRNELLVSLQAKIKDHAESLLWELVGVVRMTETPERLANSFFKQADGIVSTLDDYADTFRSIEDDSRDAMLAKCRYIAVVEDAKGAVLGLRHATATNNRVSAAANAGILRSAVKRLEALIAGDVFAPSRFSYPDDDMAAALFLTPTGAEIPVDDDDADKPKRKRRKRRVGDGGPAET